MMVTRPVSSCLLILWWILLAVSPSSHGRPPQVFRTFMPDSGPSAFGVVLGPELALCYDPLRGGVNQIWRGSLDLAPTRKAKINQPAAMVGEVFYTESTVQPLRVVAADKESVRRFKGYRYEQDAVVFEFTLDGVPVSERLRALANGGGVERVISVPAGTVLFFQADAQPGAQVTITGAEEVDPGVWRHEGGEGKVFTMRIEPHTKS